MIFMDNAFEDTERLYRAVYPPSHPGMYWKKDGRISPSAFADPKGLLVERGFYRKPEEIVEKMKRTFSGCIVSLSVRVSLSITVIVNSYFDFIIKMVL